MYVRGRTRRPRRMQTLPNQAGPRTRDGKSAERVDRIAAELSRHTPKRPDSCSCICGSSPKHFKEHRLTDWLLCDCFGLWWIFGLATHTRFYADARHLFAFWHAWAGMVGAYQDGHHQVGRRIKAAVSPVLRIHLASTFIKTENHHHYHHHLGTTASKDAQNRPTS